MFLFYCIADLTFMHTFYTSLCCICYFIVSMFVCFAHQLANYVYIFYCMYILLYLCLFCTLQLANYICILSCSLGFFLYFYHHFTCRGFSLKGCSQHLLNTHELFYQNLYVCSYKFFSFQFVFVQLLLNMHIFILVNRMHAE